MGASILEGERCDCPDKSPLAGKTIEPSTLVNVPRLVTAYFTGKPDPTVPSQRVAFGTSGHRGSAFDNAFNKAHILAISQAICLYRSKSGIKGPLFIAFTSLAASTSSALATAGSDSACVSMPMVGEGGGYTPMPVVSHAILSYNKNRKCGLADGIVINPSDNPPDDGGFKYNPPNGGPLVGVKIGIDPLGACVHYCQPIIERYGIAATVVSDAIDPTFRFMTVDWDGKIRMDCSSPYAMADTDADRHGIVTRSSGLMNPNHYLAAAISYLCENRPDWSRGCAGARPL
jgi:phosphoglucomutase